MHTQKEYEICSVMFILCCEAGLYLSWTGTSCVIGININSCMLLFNQFPVSILLLSGIGLPRPIPTRPKPTVYSKRKVKKRDKEQLVKDNWINVKIMFLSNMTLTICFYSFNCNWRLQNRHNCDWICGSSILERYLYMPFALFSIIRIFPLIWMILRQDFCGLSWSIQ